MLGVAAAPAGRTGRRARPHGDRSRLTTSSKIGLALHNYHGTHRSFPPAYTIDKDGKPGLSWRVLILALPGQEAPLQAVPPRTSPGTASTTDHWSPDPTEYLSPTIRSAR